MDIPKLQKLLKLNLSQIYKIIHPDFFVNDSVKSSVNSSCIKTLNSIYKVSSTPSMSVKSLFNLENNPLTLTMISFYSKEISKEMSKEMSKEISKESKKNGNLQISHKLLHSSNHLTDSINSFIQLCSKVGLQSDQLDSMIKLTHHTSVDCKNIQTPFQNNKTFYKWYRQYNNYHSMSHSLYHILHMFCKELNKLKYIIKLNLKKQL